MTSWRRLIASTLVLFTLVLAVLVYRVLAGDDPALGAGTPKVAASDDEDSGSVPSPPSSPSVNTHQS